MRRRKPNPETNAERLKRLYAVGKLTLDALMEQVAAQLDAGTLDDAPLAPRSPASAAEKWRAGVSAASPSWSAPRARDTLTGSTDE